MPVRLFLTLWLSLAGSLSAQADPVDPTPRIAVLSAFEPEWQALKADTRDMREQPYKGVRFVTGTIEGKPVVLVLTGISMVNAAMTTQMALDRYNVTRLVFSGIAGGVDPSLNIGDIAVPARWGQYLESVLARETPDGYRLPPGVSTPYPGFGMLFPRGVRVFREGRTDAPRQFWFEADPGLLEVARTADADAELQRCASPELCLTTPPKVRIGGNGVSGASFVDNAGFRAYVFDTFQAQVLDMETAAVAHVAATNGVPYIAFRALSDLAGGGPGENEIRIFEQLAANNSVKVLLAFLRALPD